jgi:hypothetical protein
MIADSGEWVVGNIHYKDTLMFYNSKIARGALSSSTEKPGLCEIDERYANVCREIMDIAIQENRAPADCVNQVCSRHGVGVNELVQVLDANLG